MECVNCFEIVCKRFIFFQNLNGSRFSVLFATIQIVFIALIYWEMAKYQYSKGNNFSQSLWPTAYHQQTISKYLQNECAIVFDSLFIKRTPIIMHLYRISILNFCKTALKPPNRALYSFLLFSVTDLLLKMNRTIITDILFSWNFNLISYFINEFANCFENERTINQIDTNMRNQFVAYKI